MSKYPSRGKSNPDRWSDPERLANEAQHSIEVDLVDLGDFFTYCKRTRPQYFKGMGLEEFKRWNDLRLEHLGEPDSDLLNQILDKSGLEMLANRILLSRVSHAAGFTDDVMDQLVAIKNAMIEDLADQPDEVVVEALTGQFDRFIADQEPRKGLSKKAQIALDKLKRECGIHD